MVGAASTQGFRHAGVRVVDRTVVAVPLKAQVAEGRVIVRTTAERPVIFALAIPNGQVVDARDAPPHQPVRVELPVLVAIAAKPVAGIVVPFICKAHGDPVVAERPHLLNQPIIELAIPFAREKRLDRLAALNKLRAVAPGAVDGIGEGDAGGIASVPGVFGETRLLRGGLGCERRQRWAGHRLTPTCSSSSVLAARITWAANSSRPRAFAVLRLMASALLLRCAPGRAPRPALWRT